MSEKPLRKEVKTDTESRMGRVQPSVGGENKIPRKDVGNGSAAGEYRRKQAQVQLPPEYGRVNNENDKDLDDSY